jgi:hypothetical protein
MGVVLHTVNSCVRRKKHLANLIPAPLINNLIKKTETMEYYTPLDIKVEDDVLTTDIENKMRFLLWKLTDGGYHPDEVLNQLKEVTDIVDCYKDKIELEAYKRGIRMGIFTFAENDEDSWYEDSNGNRVKCDKNVIQKLWEQWILSETADMENVDGFVVYKTSEENPMFL